MNIGTKLNNEKGSSLEILQFFSLYFLWFIQRELLQMQTRKNKKNK